MKPHFETLGKTIQSFIADQSGATAIEYTVIAFVIATSVVYGATTIGETDVVKLNTVTSVWPGNE